MLGEFPDVVFDLHWKENYMNYIQVYVYSICERNAKLREVGKKITMYENNMFYIKTSSKSVFCFESKKLLRCDETEGIDLSFKIFIV